MSNITRKTEIRNLFDTQLTRILDLPMGNKRGWEVLMLKYIPKNLDDISKERYTLKYNAEHVRLIESGSIQRQRRASEILLEEWGTSGRIRPNVEHLLNLLIKAELFRAADYVAINILSEPPPQRPIRGPAAPIDITLPDEEETTQKLEGLLSDLHYPLSDNLANGVNSVFTNNNNVDYYTKPSETKNIEIYGATNSSVMDGSLPCFPLPRDKVSNSAFTSNIPNLSTLQNCNSSNIGSANGIPVFSDLLKSTLSSRSSLSEDTEMSSTSEYSEEVNIPNLSAFDQASFSNIPNLSAFDQASNSNIPNLSAFDQASNSNIPNLSVFDQASNSNIPSFQFHSDSENVSNVPIFMLNNESTTDINGNESIQNLVIPDISALNLQDSISYNESIPNLSAFNSPDDNEDVIDSNLTEYSFELIRTGTDNFDAANVLGSGGFGVVYLARNPMNISDFVAIKRLDSQKHTPYNLHKKFKLELKILADIKHENIVKLLGYCRGGPELCLIYEYINGGNLEQKLGKCRSGIDTFSATNRLKIIMDCANGIAFLHANNVIHRDIKPANILLGENTAKLCDFGLIKMETSNTTTCTTGTSSYMSFEAMQGVVTPKVDVYALGIIICEIVTLQPVLDVNRKEKLLVHLVEDVAETNQFQVIIDSSGGGTEWISDASTLLRTALKCLSKNAPSIHLVREQIYDIFIH